ncbi:MAG: polyprenyl diphosphate synthase, partial [Candidatus Binatia bacterium]
LLKIFIRRDLAELHRSGVRVRIIGEREGLKPDLRKLLDEAEALTSQNRALNLVVAFNYGSRNEIVRAARRIAQDVAKGAFVPSDITAETISSALDTSGMPDPDLVIRTSGEIRLSNFLLWQAAYSELVFLSCFWPDFTAEHFKDALGQFAARERRFGGRNDDDVVSNSA